MAETTAQLASASADDDRAAVQMFADVVVAILVTLFFATVAFGLYLLYLAMTRAPPRCSRPPKVITSTICDDYV
jgi:hypothetical protein